MTRKKGEFFAPEILGDADYEEKPPAWYTLYTQSHCENLVSDQLSARGFTLFLPMIQVWSRRDGSKHLIERPMFPGYLFLHHAMDKNSYLEVRKARGLVRILGESWDRLVVIPDSEIWSIRAAATSHLLITSHQYLKEGQCVRIKSGPLAGVEGILVKVNLRKGLFVLSIDLLQRSIAVEVDITNVEAV